MEMDPRKKYGWHSPSGGWVVTGLSPLGEREQQVDRAVRTAYEFVWGEHMYSAMTYDEMFRMPAREAVARAWREQHAR